jgi:hypothetical protein
MPGRCQGNLAYGKGIPWCLNATKNDDVVCTIHRAHPEYAPAGKEPEPKECEACDGEGEHICLCGNEHTCGACEGTGKGH